MYYLNLYFKKNYCNNMNTHPLSNSKIYCHLALNYCPLFSAFLFKTHTNHVFWFNVQRHISKLFFSLLLCLSIPAISQTTILTSTLPARNTPAAPQTSKIELTFSRPIATGTEANVRIFGSQLRGMRTGVYSGAGSTTVIYEPTLNFAPGEQIYVSVPSSVQDARGVGVQPAVYQFSAAAGLGSGTFVGTTAIDVGQTPTSCAVADVNNDGKLDMVTGSALAPYVSICLGNGKGEFAGYLTSYLGTVATHLILADLNNDGKLDLVTANRSNNTVNVRLGDGQGAFWGSTNLSVGNGPVCVVAADVNNDGNLDLLSANAVSNTVSVQLGNGAGGFAGTTNVAVGEAPSSLTVADIDNDGKLDLLVANSRSNTMSLRTGTGTGTFVNAGELPTGNQPQSITTTDINGDGNVDILVANSLSAAITTYVGTGTRSFSAALPILVKSGINQIVAADINGDGKMDILAANATANTVHIRQGNGMGGFTALPDVVVDSGLTSIALGDVNGDTALDLLITQTAMASFGVFLNQGPPILSGFSPAKALPGTNVTITGINFTNATSVKFAGVNATNIIVNSATSITATVPASAPSGHITVTTPVAAGNSTLPFIVQFSLVSVSPVRNALAVPRNSNVALTFARPIAAGTETSIRVFGSQVHGVQKGNYNGGNTTDISFDSMLDFAPGEHVSVTVPSSVRDLHGREAVPYTYQFIAAADPSTAVFTQAPDIPSPQKDWYIVAGDVNNDGYQDLISGSIYNQNASIWLGNGQGGFTASQVISLSGPASALVLADLNNDGALDLIVPTAQSNIMDIKLNNGRGTFTSAPRIIARFARQVVASDMNNDGNLDLVYVSGDREIILLLGDGNGNFNYGGEVVRGYSISPTLLDVADFNQDGKLDIMVTDVSTNGVFDAVVGLLGDEMGHFTMSSRTVVDRIPAKLVAADINRDGIPDLVCATYGVSSGSMVNIRLGDGLGRFIKAIDVPVPYFPWDLDVIDIDGDGDLDFLTTDYLDKTASIRLNDGTGSFIASPFSPLVIGESGSTTTADFNGDGTIDFATIDRDYSNTAIKIRLNGARVLTTNLASPLSTIAVYPNPASGAVVSVTGVAPGSNLQLYDATGQKIRSTILPEDKQFSIQGLSSGLYILFAIDKQNRRYNTRLVIH